VSSGVSGDRFGYLFFEERIPPSSAYGRLPVASSTPRRWRRAWIRERLHDPRSGFRSPERWRHTSRTAV